MPKNLKKLKKLFKNDDLLELALTHKSWVNEHKGRRESNERLEFLGDAILEFVISKELFKLFPDKPEGFLTTLRANLVNTESLADVAHRLQLGKNLYLSKGEEEGGGRENPSLLANTFEAVIGAIFIDSGLVQAEDFIRVNLITRIEEYFQKPLKDAKSRLQEKVQAEGYPAPKYQVINEEGPDHEKNFTIQVMIDGKPIATGKGKNKAYAAQKAAEKALTKL